MTRTLKNLILWAIVAGAVPLGAAGCYVEATPVVDYGYTPVYYDGALVYYDGFGRPYYYRGGAVVFVPPTAPRYGYYVDHYHRYAPQYQRWNDHYGERYRNYHAPERHRAPERHYAPPPEHRR
jgi:hypothetical protein